MSYYRLELHFEHSGRINCLVFDFPAADDDAARVHIAPILAEYPNSTSQALYVIGTEISTI